MGFVSVDEFVSEVTGQGKSWRTDFLKSTTSIGTVVAGRWYDLTMFPITGTNTAYIHGNMVYNADFLSGIAGWTLGTTNWAWTAATHLLTRTANIDVSTVSQNTLCVNGVSYSVVFTMTRTAGTLNYSLGGTAGTPHALGGTYRETIVCGATASAPLVFTPDATFAGTIDIIAVTRDLGFTPYDRNGLLGPVPDSCLWTAGNVSADTKHVIGLGATVNIAAGAPATLLLVDMLGCYPRIRTDIITQQNLDNTLTLPRYTDGKKVRPYFVLNTANGANASNFVMSYTNTAPAGGQGLGQVVSNTASAIVGHMSHSGVNAGNFGPFLPLTGGDAGVKSVQSCTFNVASASAGFVDLVLCVPIAELPITTAFYMAERDLMNQLPELPRVYDGACLSWLVLPGAVLPACVFQGYVDFGWS